MTEAGYYGKPIIKPPVWKREIAWYLFTGGLAGGSSVLALAARLSGNARLARSATVLAAGGLTVSPALLVKDLGRPERFLNMFRVFKRSSPMNVGSWILSVAGTAAGVAAACEVTGRAPRTRTVAQVAAGLLGPPVATYTGVLYIYLKAFHSSDFGTAAAAGVVLFVIIFLLTLVQRATIGRAEVG